MRISLFFTALVLLFCSCKKKNDKPEVFDIDASFVHGNKIRTFSIHLPKSFYLNKNEQYPLILALHGGGGNAEHMKTISGLNTKADSSDIVIVYPEGAVNPSGVKTWNAGDCCGANALLNVDDVGFISRLIDTLVARYRIDKKRVYATGHSNGAMMCYKLANELSLKLAAIAPNAGAFQMKEPYRPVRNVPVLHINSLLDQNAKYTGGPSINALFSGLYNKPVDSCLNAIAQRAACNGGKQLIVSKPLYSVYQWTGCGNTNMEVMLYLTNDGGHSWPGGTQGPGLNTDPPSKAFENNYVIWEFFKRFSLP